MPPSPHVYCRVLGPARVTVDGADAPPGLLWRKHLALLVYLARSPRRSRPSDHLLGLLGSDRDERQARHSLSEALRLFRRILGDEQVHADVDQIRLGADAVTLDCDRFVEACEQGDWPAAAALVEGDFLEGLSVPGANEFESWLGVERVSWRTQALAALVRYAEWLVARGDAAGAAGMVLRARTLDPVSEPAARVAMRALALAGDRAAALRVAAELEHALRAQVGTAPGPETTRLAEAPGLAGAPSDALAALGFLDPDLAARFRSASAGLPVAEALSAVVLAAAAERPVLLALDDAHWIDGGTLESLAALARDTARRPVLLLFGLARGSPERGRLDDLRARLGGDLEGEVIRLGRLDAAALEALVAWALPRYDAAEAARLVRRVERDTAGIPLLAAAMLEAVAGGYKLAPDAAAWPSPKRTLVDSLPNDLPPAVVGVICQRFRQLAPAAQQLLGAAAALAERAEAGQLAHATRLDRVAVEEGLDLLEWERWLVADARGYVFAAPIVRSVLLQEMVTPGQAKRYRENRST